MTESSHIPIFDADNHMYETQEAMTQHLPARYKRVVDYVDVHGRTKIAVKGRISEYIPNPTFDVVARPGAQEDYYRKGNPEGKSAREIFGEPMRAIPAFREPAPRLELLDQQGSRPDADVPDVGQPGRGAPPGRSRGDARGHSCAERVDV